MIFPSDPFEQVAHVWLLGIVPAFAFMALLKWKTAYFSDTPFGLALYVSLFWPICLAGAVLVKTVEYAEKVWDNIGMDP